MKQAKENNTKNILQQRNVVLYDLICSLKTYINLQDLQDCIGTLRHKHVLHEVIHQHIYT